MRRILMTLACVLFPVAVTQLTAAEPIPLPAEAQAVVDRFVIEGAKQVTDADAKRMAAKAKLDTALEAVQTSEGKAGRLESAVAVQHLRADLTAGKSIDVTKPSEGQPKVVMRLLETYQSEVAKIDKDFTAKMVTLREQAIKDLEVVKVVQTKGGHLDVALVVKQTQEQLRGGQPTARPAAAVLVFGKGAQIEPTDDALLRRGGAESTIEVVLTAVASDGLLFRCGAGGNGQSLAIMGDELWFAVVGGRTRSLVKAPLGGAKPPLHLAATFAKGEVTLWVNGVPAKREKTELDAINDNGAGGGLGSVGESSNHPAMPHDGFTGELACFRYVDRVLYTAQFKPSFPLATAEGVRWQIDAQGLAIGTLKELPKARLSGELSVKR